MHPSVRYRMILNWEAEGYGSGLIRPQCKFSKRFPTCFGGKDTLWSFSFRVFHEILI